MDKREKDMSKAIGGLRRAEVLPSEERKAIAKKAAEARWGKRPPKATHKGNFKEEFGLDVDCYVLDDAYKTAVISKTGMGKALGMSARGNAFTRFISSKTMTSYGGALLREKVENPLIFQWTSGGALPPNTEIHAYDVALLIEVCNVVLQADAEGKLPANQKAIAQQARVILNASAKSGIKGLVYALAGRGVIARRFPVLNRLPSDLLAH